MMLVKHKTAVTLNDPVMMLVTLMNAQLAELGKPRTRHNGALTRVLSERTADHIAQARKACDSLGEALRQSSVEAIRQIFCEHSSALPHFRINLWWAVAVIMAGVLGNLLLLAAR